MTTPVAIPRKAGRRKGGFSLAELVMVIALLAIALAPMIDAFKPALTAQSTLEDFLVFHNRARGTLSRALALPFSTVDAARGNPANLAVLFGGSGEADKESFVYKGVLRQPTVAITDSSGGTGGLLQVSVSLENVTLRSLKASY